MSEILSAVERMLHDRRHLRADAELEALRAERDETKRVLDEMVEAFAATEGWDTRITNAAAYEVMRKFKAAEDQVRVLTEALADAREIIAVVWSDNYALRGALAEMVEGVERGTARGAPYTHARSVLAAVPSEETTP
jgi:hypothetical protein